MSPAAHPIISTSPREVDRFFQAFDQHPRERRPLWMTQTSEQPVLFTCASRTASLWKKWRR